MPFLRQEPAHIRTIETFVARNPWTAAQRETWSLENCRWVTRFTGLRKPSRATDARIVFEGDGSPLMGLRSHSDGRLHLIPCALFERLPGQEIEFSDLPELLHRLGTVKRYDFIPPERNYGVVMLSSILILVFFLLEIFIVPKMHSTQTNGFETVRAGPGFGIHAVLLPILILGSYLMWVGVTRLRRYSRHSKLIRDFLRKRKKISMERFP